jgi:hypothetical protein
MVVREGRNGAVFKTQDQYHGQPFFEKRYYIKSYIQRSSHEPIPSIHIRYRSVQAHPATGISSQVSESKRSLWIDRKRWS